MADNDLALGKLVDAVSHSPYCPHRSGGVDAVDNLREFIGDS
jgi:hypothetical protein